jgi:hypothetical protein
MTHLVGEMKMANKNAAMAQLVEVTWGKALEDTVRSIIEEHIRWGNDDEIKQALRDCARKILIEDAEIQQMIRDALVSWIGQQTAAGYATKQADNAKRFG